MEDVLHSISLNSWEESFSDQIQSQAIKALETGKVLFFPHLPFMLKEEEKIFLDPSIVDPKSKNISYDIRSDRLGGTTSKNEAALKQMIKRYALNSRHLFEKLFPSYNPFLKQARTSYRPVEASGRNISYRKDDTRLHVDSFPANPTKGQRILRIFSNVNPNGKPRVWRVGEPFSQVAEKMAPRASKPIPGLACLLKLLRITKEYRTPYDHYMLQIHDTMKGDEHYQKTVSQKEILFPSGSTWIVYTDQVSHAAMSGQFLFEQTFHLPREGLMDKTTAPQSILEKFFQKPLV